MSWSYINHDAGSVSSVTKEILATLKNFSGTPRASVKIALSDQRSGAARGVVFVNSHATGKPPAPTSAQAVKTFLAGNDYVGKLYGPAATFLNSLPESQAFWARATMTNLKEGNATLEIWY